MTGVMGTQNRPNEGVLNAAVHWMQTAAFYAAAAVVRSLGERVDRRRIDQADGPDSPVSVGHPTESDPSETGYPPSDGTIRFANGSI